MAAHIREDVKKLVKNKEDCYQICGICSKNFSDPEIDDLYVYFELNPKTGNFFVKPAHNACPLPENGTLLPMLGLRITSLD